MKILNTTLKLTTAAIFLLLFSCSHSFKKSKSLTLKAKSKSSVTGMIKVFENKERLKIKVSLKGLKPNHLHGFHVHENGDCSSSDAKSAGGHFSVNSSSHGKPNSKNHHIGDLGNLVSDAQGNIDKTITSKKLTLKDDAETSIINRAFVLHADKDDFKSQPSGNSGKRIGCVVIK